MLSGEHAKSGEAITMKFTKKSPFMAAKNPATLYKVAGLTTAVNQTADFTIF